MEKKKKDLASQTGIDLKIKVWDFHIKITSTKSFPIDFGIL